MSNAGYSAAPLLKKLGLNPSMKVLLINPPANYFDLLQMDIRSQFCKRNECPDFIHLFIQSFSELKFQRKRINVFSQKNSRLIIWVSWYKKASGIATDVTEDIIRNFALANNLVDIKVCAVDEKWSGLKLVVPLAKR